MSKNSKIFIGCMALALFAGLGSASAADNRVIFKIHDIEPVKNEDGNVTSCEFVATFYNRSDKELLNTALTLAWADEVISEAINQEERNIREIKRSNKKKAPRYNTATYSSGVIGHNLRLPSLKPGQQITMKSKIVTDRCFLLLNDMEIEVTNCGYTGSSKSDSCANLFQYISPKNAEYYFEFKQISIEEEDAQSDLEKKQQEKESDNLYKQTVDKLNTLSTQIVNAQKNI